MTEDDAHQRSDNLPTVGFVVVSHGLSAQLQRLIAAIDREYDFPPIACHHDFGQAPLDVSQFGKNVEFVMPFIATRWGGYSVVQATLAAIELLYTKHSPDWFFHLSATDYPAMSGIEVRRYLANAGCDAFVDARPIDAGTIPASITIGTHNPKLDHYDNAAVRRQKRLFYTSREIWIPLIRWKPKLRLGRFTYRTGWRVKNVYADFPCFHGDFWFCGNAKTAKLLREPTEKHLTLRRHLQSRSLPDEAYFQTVIMNQPGLRVCLDNKRFAEWNGGGAHPMFLGEEQLDEMLASNAFFARKFQHGSNVLDRLDSILAASRSAR